jgi:neutral amino acid transport system permease protein
LEAGAPTTTDAGESGFARAKTWANNHPAVIFMSLVLLIGIALTIIFSLREVAQTGLNGLSTGSYVALGAVGLTLVYGILKLVNFAHGDLLTFGAYMAFVVSVSWDGPLLLGILAAVVLTALLGLFFELTMWGPMRAKGAGFLQLVLMSIGLAFVIRATIQFIAGGDPVFLDVNRSSASTPFDFIGIDLRLRNVLWVSLTVGVVVLVLVGLLLQFTLLGKKMRALSDSLDLAETTGIDTERIVLITWVFAGGLAGLAGVLLGMVSQVKPEVGFELLLPIFAAVVLGGIGNPFGALAAGLTLGVLIEWATIPDGLSNWKFAVGFVVLILALIVRPQGVFGKARAV